MNSSLVICYKLVGFLKIYNTVPEFLFPVFEALGKEYIQERHCFIINNFCYFNLDRVPKKNFIQYETTIYLNEYCYLVYAYQNHNNQIIVANINEFYEMVSKEVEKYNKRIDENSKFVKELLNDFLQDNFQDYIVGKHLKNYYKGLDCFIINIADDFKYLEQSILPILCFYKNSQKNFIVQKFKFNTGKELRSQFSGNLSFYSKVLLNINTCISKILFLLSKYSVEDSNNCQALFYCYTHLNKIYKSLLTKRRLLRKKIKNISVKVITIESNSNSLDKLIKKKIYNRILYNKFCALVDEYSDLCLIDATQNDKIEFVDRFLRKKQWLLSVDQYSLIIKKYANNYLQPLNITNWSNLGSEDKRIILENNALKLIIDFLLDVLQDKRTDVTIKNRNK